MGRKRVSCFCVNIHFIRYHAHPRFLPYPAKYVSIRGAEEERYTVIDITEVDTGKDPRVLEEIELSRAIFEVCIELPLALYPNNLYRVDI